MKHSEVQSGHHMAVGTRAVVKHAENGTFHVVCATCYAGGATGYRERLEALKRATIISAMRCRTCGAS